MLDGHALGAAVDQRVEAAASPRRGHIGDLLTGELDGQHEARGAECEQFASRVLIEAVERVVAYDISSIARELREQSEMAGEDGRAEREPLVEMLSFRGAHNGRRSQPKGDSARGHRARERGHARDRRQRVPQEWIERDLRRAGIGGGIGILDSADVGCEHEWRRLRCRESMRRGQFLRRSMCARHTLDRGNRRLDVRRSLGVQRLERPVTSQEQLLDRALPKPVDLAHRNEQTRGERAIID
jgi:hypothetical protein